MDSERISTDLVNKGETVISIHQHTEQTIGDNFYFLKDSGITLLQKITRFRKIVIPVEFLTAFIYTINLR